MASIAAIIRADRRVAVPHLLSLSLGLALLALAGPRAVGDLMLLKPAAMLAGIETGTRPGAPAIAAAARAAEGVADGPVAARANRVAGQLRMAAALPLGGTDTSAGRAEFGRAADDFAAALARAPGDRYAWWWLVVSRWNNAQHLAAAQAWRASALSGLFDPVLMFARIEGGVRLWPYLDPAGREAFGAQLATHWRWGPGGLAELLARLRAEAIVPQALAANPDIAEDLARRMAARR